MVVMELLDKDIISDGVRERIEKADGPRHRSEILHAHLKRTCTEEAFRIVCGIIASVRGNPKMSALGKDMQRSLESGECMCMSICMHFLFLPLIATRYQCVCIALYIALYISMCVQVCLAEEDMESWLPSLVLPHTAVDSPNR